MAFVDAATAAEYREAYESWTRQIEHVHTVFLGEETLRPDALKGLLNRESRAWEKYSAARNRLLGLDAELPAEAESDPNANPFR